jgi:class 3 adenylate cyclase
MFEAINNNGGTVNQMVGDGLMAVFGAPIFHEDHCERAVRAGLEMLKQLKIFNEQQSEQGKVQVRIGIGIASGEVIAGYTGTQSRATYTCIGDTVNLAARIENHTKTALRPLLIDFHTQQGLPESFRVESLGEVLFKGKQQSTHIFAVAE